MPPALSVTYRNPLLAALAWLGSQGTRALAAIVFVGLAVPPVGAALKPFVAEAIFVLLCIAFMRVDPAALRRYLSRPGLVLAATAWTALAVPFLFGAACVLAGLDARSPDLLLGLVLQAVASPLMASPALAAVMGLDATLVLVTLVASSALVPFTAPLFARLFLGAALTLSPAALGATLLAMLLGSVCVAAIVRRFCGLAAIQRHRRPVDGVNILVLLVFVAAIMSDVAPRVLVAPLLVAELMLLAFAVFFALLIVTAFLFRRAGPDRALALGMMAAQRNVGLMLAATGGALPGLTWLYFALSQFPIFLAPQLLRPIARRVLAAARTESRR